MEESGRLQSMVSQRVKQDWVTSQLSLTLLSLKLEGWKAKIKAWKERLTSQEANSEAPGPGSFLNWKMSLRGQGFCDKSLFQVYSLTSNNFMVFSLVWLFFFFKLHLSLSFYVIKSIALFPPLCCLGFLWGFARLSPHLGCNFTLLTFL